MSNCENQWAVVDPARVLAGYYGVSFFDDHDAAYKRAAMFPGSIVCGEWSVGDVIRSIRLTAERNS